MTGLDYSQGCVNFRDVGEWINLIEGHVVFPERCLYRGGKIDFVFDAATTDAAEKEANENTAAEEEAATFGKLKTIVCVRNGPDSESLQDKLPSAKFFHCGISKNYDKYHTRQHEVRDWLQDIMVKLSSKAVQRPVLVHCTSGKDRTGVVVAALLLALGIQRQTIIEEYLLSDGDVRSQWIENALEEIGDVDTYFRRVDLVALRRRWQPSNTTS